MIYDESWPDSWKLSHRYDQLELYGDRSAPGYTSAYRRRMARVMELAARAASPGDRVLDIAAAQGNFTLALAEKGFRVTWNDLRSDLAGYVEGKRERGEVEYRSGNILEIDPGEPYDLALMLEVIEHVAHPDRFLERVARLVKPGGALIMSTPNGAYITNRLPRFSECADPSVFESRQFEPNSDGHIFLLHEDEIRALAERAGLEILALELYGNPLTCGHLKSVRVLSLLPEWAVDACERLSLAMPRAIRSRLHAGWIGLFERAA